MNQWSNPDCLRPIMALAIPNRCWSLAQIGLLYSVSAFQQVLQPCPAWYGPNPGSPTHQGELQPSRGVLRVPLPGYFQPQVLHVLAGASTQSGMVPLQLQLLLSVL